MPGKDDGGTDGVLRMLRVDLESGDRNTCDAGVRSYKVWREENVSLSCRRLSARNDASLCCLVNAAVNVNRSGVLGEEKMLPVSLGVASRAIELLRLLVVRFRKPETVDVKDFFEASDGVRDPCTWKFDDGRRAWLEEALGPREIFATLSFLWNSRCASPFSRETPATGTMGASVGTLEPLASRSKRFWRSSRYSSSLGVKMTRRYAMRRERNKMTYSRRPCELATASSFSLWASVILSDAVR